MIEYSKVLATAIDVAAEQLKITKHELLDDTSVFIYGTTRAINAVVRSGRLRRPF